MAAAVTSLILSPLASQGSGAAVDAVMMRTSGRTVVTESRVSGIAESRDSVRPRPKCLSVRQALRFYRHREAEHLRAMAAPLRRASWPPDRGACAYVRWLVERAKERAYTARIALTRWRHEYAWWLWLPAKWYRIARCETGVNWRHDSGTYVSAFGIYRPAYEAFHRWTGHNTPREQFEVAAAIQRRYGWSAWGCGGA